MTNSEFSEIRLLLALLIFGIALVILAIGLTHPGTAGYIVDGLAGMLILILWIVGRLD
jgi:hypothetical protein